MRRVLVRSTSNVGCCARSVREVGSGRTVTNRLDAERSVGGSRRSPPLSARVSGVARLLISGSAVQVRGGPLRKSRVCSGDASGRRFGVSDYDEQARTLEQAVILASPSELPEVGLPLLEERILAFGGLIRSVVEREPAERDRAHTPDVRARFPR